MTNEPSGPSDQHDIPPAGAPPEREATSGTATTQPARRLTRSRRDRMISGVAGGLAEYIGADPTIVRVVIIVLALLTGGGVILLYLGAWLVMPESEAGGEAAERQRRGGGASGIFWGIVLIVIGLVALLWRLDVTLPPWDALLAGVLIAVGLLLVIEARRGLHGGLLAVAILITLVLGATAMVNINVESGFGERIVVVQDAGQIDRDYGHAFGTLRLDLRDVDLPEGTTTIRTSIMFGELRVQLPDDVGLRSTSTTLFGSTQLPAQEHPGFAIDREFRTADYDTATRRLHLEITTLFGSTRVLR